MNGILQPDDGVPQWSTDPNERFAFHPNYDELGITPKGPFKLSTSWVTHPTM